MESNNYSLAGWLSVAQVVLLPLSFIVSFVEEGIAWNLFNTDRPFIGPSDFIMLLFSIIWIYILNKLKQLLNDHYQCHDLDLLIWISIWWMVIFQVFIFGLGILLMILWPVNEFTFGLIFLIFFGGAIVTIGLVDIFIAIKLLKIKERLSEYLKVFAFLSLAAGFCEVTILLSPLAVLLVPVISIVLALIFFKDRPVVEYV